MIQPATNKPLVSDRVRVRFFAPTSRHALRTDADKGAAVRVWLHGNLALPGQQNRSRSTKEQCEQVLATLTESGIEGVRATLRTARGQYLLVLETPESVISFRSELCAKSLFYSLDAVHDELRGFLQEGHHTPDREYLANYLVNPSFLQYRSTFSPLEGVRRLPPGHMLTHKDGRVTLSRYESHARTLRWDYSQTAADVVPEIKRLMGEIISETIEQHSGPVACELSGGLDSSYVNCLVADRFPKHPAIMYGYAEHPSHRFSEECAKLIAQERGIELKVVRADELQIPQFENNCSYREEPALMYWQGELFGRLLAANILPGSLLFTGYGADQIFMRSTEVLPHYLHTRDWSRALQTARAMGNAMDRSRVNLLWQSVVCQLPLKVRVSLFHFWEKVGCNPFNVEDVASTPTSQRLVNWMRSPLQDYKETQVADFQDLDFSYLSYPMHVMGEYLRERNIHHAHPFCDSRLIRFLREDVSAHLVHDFSTPYKHLLREAQRGSVPEKVRTRKKNEFRFDGFFSMVTRKNEDYLRALLTSLPPFVEEFVDKRHVLLSFEQLKFGVFSPSTYYLEHLIAYLIWWKSLDRFAAPPQREET